MLNEKTVQHLKEHVKYPATGMEIMEACNQWSDVPKEDKEMAEDLIDPDESFQNAQEVLDILEGEEEEVMEEEGKM